MLVFWQEKLVFFAVPKTGTTALEGALSPHAAIVFRNPPELKHAPAYRFKNRIQPMLNCVSGEQRFEKVAMVRHPIEWLSSWYRYRCRDGLVGQPQSTRGVSFDQFVVEYCKDQPAVYANVGTQSNFIVLPDQDDFFVDHLFSYEQFDQMIGFFEERLRIKISPKTLNVSPDFEVYLSKDVEQLYRDTHAREFELWERAGL